MYHTSGTPQDTTLPVLSVLIPASNEEALISVCLASLAKCTWSSDARVEIIVISNGSSDRTADVANEFRAHFTKRGWALHVLDREEGSKLAALNAGDRIARAEIRIYLDADVTVDPALLEQVYETLSTHQPRYCSGALRIAHAKNWVTRAYARVYSRVPFLTHGVPGAGLFAVNAAGRMRWGEFPKIISDDTFVRLSFRPDERVAVDAGYTWPLVEGWSNLVRVRRRQNEGVDEIRHRFPELLENDDKPAFPAIQKLKIALRDPVGFAVYSGVALAVRLTPKSATAWSRGR